MSLLYRAEQWLTIAQLVPAWANELADANSSARQLEGDLWHYLREDVINGLFDDSGPLRNGSRLGLRVIDHRSSQPPYVAGRLLFGKMHLPFRSKGDHILAAKEAVLHFARRRELSPPSWWSDATKGGSELSRAPEELKPASEAMTKEEMWSVCNEEQAAGRKEPNVKELSALVQPRLQRKGRRASRQWIEKLAEAPEFKRRRRPRGKTVASERRKK
jgi:hypothetical protein